MFFRFYCFFFDVVQRWLPVMKVQTGKMTVVAVVAVVVIVMIFLMVVILAGMLLIIQHGIDS